MDKFDTYKFFYEGLLSEDQAQTQQHQQNPEPTPQQNQQVVNSTSSPFDQFTGQTIENIKFQPHENGGSVIIKLANSNLPLVISWTGTRVTSKHKEIVSLT